MKGGGGGEGSLFARAFSVYVRDKKAGLTQQGPDFYLFVTLTLTHTEYIYIYIHAFVSLWSSININSNTIDINNGAVELFPMFRQDSIFQLLLL